MSKDCFTYLLTYSFDQSHFEIRDNFREWLKTGVLKAVFCDESTYGLHYDNRVSELIRILRSKLEELYGEKQSIEGDIVNVFCSTIKTDYKVVDDRNTKKIIDKIDQHSVWPLNNTIKI